MPSKSDSLMAKYASEELRKGATEARSLLAAEPRAA